MAINSVRALVTTHLPTHLHTRRKHGIHVYDIGMYYKALSCAAGKKIYFDVSEISSAFVWTRRRDPVVVGMYQTILISRDVLTMLKTTTTKLDGNI